MSKVLADKYSNEADNGAPEFEKGLNLTGSFLLSAAAKSGDYTILDNDSSIFLVTTGSTDIVLTLPTASANANRIIKAIKIDSGTGSLTLDGEGSETINGRASESVYGQYGIISVICDGTNWYTIEPIQDRVTYSLDTDFSGGTVEVSRSGTNINMTIKNAAWSNSAGPISSALLGSRLYDSSVEPVVGGHTENSRYVKVIVSNAGQVKLEIMTSSDVATAAAGTSDSADVDQRDYCISYSIPV